jgi:hypothetical protein
MNKRIMFGWIIAVTIFSISYKTLLPDSVNAAEEVTLYEVDLSKGNAGTGTVSGGQFVAKGWTPMEGSDNVLWNFSNIGAVEKGYVSVTMTNLDPKKQETSQNQFLGLNASCEEAGGKGVKIRMRMGKGYRQFKVEFFDGVGPKWIEVPLDPLSGPFDPSKYYQFKFAWAKNGVQILFDNKAIFKNPVTITGFCSLRIGETWYPSMQAFRGPIYTGIKYVSESGGPQPTPTPNLLTSTIELNKDWNLISLPIQPAANIQIEDLLSGISGKYQAIYAYDGNTYKHYIPGATGNNLNKIEAGVGYWVYMNQAATLTITGTEAPKSINLKANWNLVGYNSMTAKPVASAVASIAGKFIVIYGFDGKTYKGYAPNGINDLEQLEPGHGYWIFATENVVWTLN